MPYLGSKPTKGNFSDLNGAKLILDADADTSITADTDDQIDIEISGANDFKFSANAFNVLSGSTLTVDSGATIANSGTATGFGGSDPSSADGDTLGTASLEWSDLYLADGGVIYFGNDQEVTLTHNHDTSLTCNLMVAATTFEPNADTAAGDNAAMGYTSVLGAILTGQGSTNDVTLVNDADATVLGIPTGTTNVDIVGALTAASLGLGDETAATYDTGTWTPTIAFGGGATGVGYGSQAGRYMKFGIHVFVDCYLTLSAKGSSTGTAEVGGLPFTNRSGGTPLSLMATRFDNIDLATNYTGLFIRVNSNAQTTDIREVGDNVDASIIADADFADASVIGFSGWYEAAA